MNKTTKTLIATVAALGLSATAAFASPITLPAFPQVVKATYNEFENVIQGTNANNNPFAIDAGDTLKGIVKISSIDNLNNSNTTFPNTLPPFVQLTGVFQLSVLSGSIPLTGATNGQNITIGLGSTDYFQLYVNALNPATNFDASAADSVARAQSGSLWLSLAGDYNGTGVVTITPNTAYIYNQNWSSVAANNTGYNFLNEVWPFTAGTAISSQEVSQVYFDGQLTDNLGGTPNYTNKATGNFYAAAQPVPEPGTMVLLGAGLAGLAISARRKKYNS